MRGPFSFTGNLLFSILRRLRAFFEHLAVPDRAFASIARQLEILGQLKRVRGTRVFAQTAEHAPGKVVGELGQFLPPRFRVADAVHDDQLLGAGHRAEVAGDAKRFVGLGVFVEPRRAAIALRYPRPLQRILLGINLLRMLVAKRDAKALDQVPHQNFSQQAGHFHIRLRITGFTGDVTIRVGEG